MANNEKMTARMVGILFITVMVSWFIGFMLIDPILNVPDYLPNVQANQTRVMAGALFELIEVTAVVGIIALMFPVLRKYRENMALGYAGLRIIECTMLMLVALSALFLVVLSQQYGETGAQDGSYLYTIGALFLAARGELTHTLIIPIFYGLSAAIFFYVLYQADLIPRWLSIPGAIVAVLVAAGAVVAFFGIDQLAIFGAPMGLIEIALGIWLIVKGFNAPAADTRPVEASDDEAIMRMS